MSGRLLLTASLLSAMAYSHQVQAKELCSYEQDGVVTISNQGGRGKKVACYTLRAKKRRYSRKKARKSQARHSRKSGQFAPGVLRPLTPVAVLDGQGLIPNALELSVSNMGGIHRRAEQLNVLSGPSSALAQFTAAMKGKELGSRTSPVVVVQYGDSHTRASVFTKQLRSTFAEGNFAPGFVQFGHPVTWNATVKKFGRWKRENWMYGRSEAPYGPLGVSYWSRTPGSALELDLKEAPSDKTVRVTVFFEPTPGHRPFFVESGGQLLAQVSSVQPAGAEGPGGQQDNPEPETAILGKVTVELPAGHRTLDVYVGGSKDKREGETRIFGFLVQYQDSPLEWDVMGVGGTIVNNLVHRGDPSVDRYLVDRNPDLMLIWYGSNSILAKGFDPKKYAETYRAFLKRTLASTPGASCVAIGPPDLARRPDKTCFLNDRQRRTLERGRRKARRKVWKERREDRICHPDALINHSKRGRYRFPVPEVQTMSQWRSYSQNCQYRTAPLLEEMIAEQRRVAHSEGCLYFDMYRFMGGPESIHRWACEASPRLAQLDQTHLNVRGYRVVAAALGSSMTQVMNSLEVEPDRDPPTEPPVDQISP